MGRSTGPVSLVSQYSDVLGGEQVELGGSGIALVTSCPQSHRSLAWFSCVHPPAATADVHDGAGSGPDGHGWARWGRVTCHRLHSWANATGSILGTRWARWTRPQSEDSTQMPQAQFLGPQEPGMAMGPGTVPMPPMSESTASGPDDPIVCFGCAEPVRIRTHSKTKETDLACAQFPLCATPWTLATWPDFPTCRGCGKHTVM